MKKTRKSCYANVMRRIPEAAREVVEVAILNTPEIVIDLDKIVRTHSCRPAEAEELVEHIVALITSELPDMDRRYLRRMAFGTTVIDGDAKKSRHEVIAEISGCNSDGWSMTLESGWSMWTDRAADGYEPHVGSKMLQYTICFSCVLGLVIDGHVFRYKTYEQEQDEGRRRKEEQRALERTKFSEHDAAIQKLPEILQRRIENFQRAPYFREDLEPYEIFVCEQAALIADRLKTVQELLTWYDLDYEQQADRIPEIKEAGHSGNSFGISCLLARLLLEDQDSILKVPGALAPLVGSDAYLPLEERSQKSA